MINSCNTFLLFFFPVQSSSFLFVKKVNSRNVSLDLHVDGMCNPSAPKTVVTLHRTSEESDMSDTALSFLVFIRCRNIIVV